MSKFYMQYHLDTGEIFRGFCCPENDSQLFAMDDTGIIEGFAEPTTHYVNPATNEFVAKTAGQATIDKTEIAADGVDCATISGLAYGSRVTVWDVGIYVVDDGTFELTADTEGAYLIIVNTGPYLEQRFTVNAS